MNHTELLELLERVHSLEAAEDVHWKSVENRLGTVLPTDYKRLIDELGAGCLFNTLCLFSPFSKRLNLFEEHDGNLAARSGLLQSFGDGSYTLFPSEGGLLVVAGSEDGNRLMWETTGAADSWPLVWMSAHMVEIERFHSNLVNYLLDWANGSIMPMATYRTDLEHCQEIYKRY